jgi:replicative DNA helicase
MNELPNSPETEQLVLAAVFLDDTNFAELGELSPKVFYTDRYRKVYTAMRNVAMRNEPVNPVTVGTEFKKLYPSTELTITEMTNWTHGLPMFTGLGVYISTLKDKALKREIIGKCHALAESARTEDELGQELAGRGVTEFQDAYSEALDHQKPTVHVAEALDSNYERWEKMQSGAIVSIETGIANVDRQLTGGGLEKGMFHVIGARPGKGKTSLGLDIAAHNIFQGNVVAFFTMELSRDVLMDRFLAPLAGVPRYMISSKFMSDDIRQRLTAVGESLKPLSFYINHKARTLEQMRLALKDIARKTGGRIDLVITDFLTKMRGNGRSKYEAVSENANGLAEFAVEFNCASIALAQLSRAVTKRNALEGEEEGKVETTDFRDSGEIEELARTILALWGSDESYPARPVNISCIKQGEGALFDEKVIFNTDYMTFGSRYDVTRPKE